MRADRRSKAGVHGLCVSKQVYKKRELGIFVLNSFRFVSLGSVEWLRKLVVRLLGVTPYFSS